MRRINNQLKRLVIISSAALSIVSCSQDSKSMTDVSQKMEDSSIQVENNTPVSLDIPIMDTSTAVDNLEVKKKPTYRMTKTEMVDKNFNQNVNLESKKYPSLDGKHRQGYNTFKYDIEGSEWILIESDVKHITLSGIGDEKIGLNEQGQAQIDYIADMLQTEKGMTALIKGHTDANKQLSDGTAMAKWIKAKLVIGHDAVADRIVAKGVGNSEPIEDLSIFDDAQNRVTIEFVNQ